MDSNDVNADELIDKLLSVGEPGVSLTDTVTEDELIALCIAARDVFMLQPAFLEINAPLTLVGDTHGQYPDLLRVLHQGGFPPTVNYLFLGDYVDRGQQCLETMGLLLAYKVLYKDNFFLLRGNHECSAINRVYGFYDECQRRYSVRLWSMFQDVFNTMPFCALIAGKILCMHGGLSPAFKTFDQLRSMRRPIDPPNPSLLVDLLWSDPDKYTTGWRMNTRGVSYVFGLQVVIDFCKAMNVELIVRGHQVVQDGFEFFCGRRLVTVFSAPHYCGEFDNAAAIMTIEENLLCSFVILHPSETPTITTTSIVIDIPSALPPAADD